MFTNGTRAVLTLEEAPCPCERHCLISSGAGPFVYRLGRQVFNLERGVRFPYGLPSQGSDRQVAFINRGQPEPRHVAYNLQRCSSINAGLVFKHCEGPILGILPKRDPKSGIGLRNPSFAVNCGTFGLFRHLIKVEPVHVFWRKVILQKRSCAPWVRNDLPEQGIVLPERQNGVRLLAVSDRGSAPASTASSGCPSSGRF